MVSGWGPIGAHQIDLELAPGESRELIFVLGYVENPRDEKWEAPGIVNRAPARALLAQFSTMPLLGWAIATRFREAI